MAELLAKPDVPLIDHLADVIRLGAEIASRLDLPEPLRAKALLACALHDIGKATDSFQAFMQAARKADEAKRNIALQSEQASWQRLARQKKAAAYPHALASMPFVLVAERSAGSRYEWAVLELEATAAVLTHHSPLGPELYKGFEAPPRYLLNPLRHVIEELWSLLERHGVKALPPVQEFWEQLRSLLDSPPAALLDEPLWIDGAQRTLRGVLRSLNPLSFSQVKAVLHLADWLASARRPHSRMLFLESASSSIERHIQKKGFAMHRFQEEARAVSRQSRVLWLRAPTGSGKTEALLLWAGDTERLIYLLPTQATTNAMWERLRGIYSQGTVGLAHGRANYILHQRQEEEEDPLDLRLFGSVFAKPVTVATLDQYLVAHLNGRHWEERRTLVRHAAVIIDEIHAYEPYTLGMLQAALEREPPARIAFASATLPRALQALFPHGFKIEVEPALWAQQRHHLILLENEALQDHLERAVELAKEGQCVLIVANTVEQSQEIYRILRDNFRWRPLRLLHARMILRDRQRLEDQVKDREPGSIFIATQVVEVSLDISYNALLTEIAPLDALAQRMGRVNRRGEKAPAPMWICGAWSKGAEAIYGKEILEESLALLQELPSMPSNRDLAEAVNRLYDRVIASPKWRREFEEGYNTLREIQEILGCYTIDLSDEEMRKRFTARRSPLSVDVLPAVFVQEAYRLYEQGQGWRIVEWLAPVPIWWLQKADAFVPLPDLRVIQANLRYDPELGLLPPIKEHRETLSIT